MKRLIVICIDGSGASSRDERDTLSFMFYKTLRDLELYNSSFEYLYSKTFSPHWWRLKKRKQIRRLLENCPHRDGVLFVAKSLGAYRLLRDFQRHFLPLAGQFSRCAIVTIDPHGIDPFATFRPNPRPIILGKWSLKSSWLDIRNVYQKSRYPMGATVLGGKAGIRNSIRVDSNHTDIIRHSEAVEAYSRAIRWCI
jgi:hypothetical protein